MFETSQDLLFVVLAFCIFWLTVFLCWLLITIISIVRDAGSLVHSVRNAVERVDQLAHTVRERFEHSAASLTIVAQALREVVVWAIEERKKKQRPPSRKKSQPADEE